VDDNWILALRNWCHPFSQESLGGSRKVWPGCDFPQLALMLLLLARQHLDCKNLLHFSTNVLSYAFSALTLLVGRQEGHPACKKLSGEVLEQFEIAPGNTGNLLKFS